MRRFVLLLAAAMVFVPTNSNIVVAESNADDLIRLRFESTVSHVYNSHPSLQVGDKVHFELTVDPSNSVPDDGHSYLSECEMFADDPMMNYSDCEEYGWNVPGSAWAITYLRNGETIYTESGDANYLLAVEGGIEYWCDPDCFPAGNGQDYFYVYASSWSDDVMYFHNFDGDFDPSGVSAAGLIDDAIDNTLWDIGMFDYRRPTWNTYHYDYLTPQDYATVIRQTSIGFDATGGSDEPTAIVEDAGTAVVVPDDVPTRTGFVFEGWNTTADGSGQTYVAGDAITLPATGSLSLYAQWVQELASEPTELSVEIGDTQASLEWTAPSLSGGGSVTGYRVQSSTNGTDWTTEIADTSAQGVMVRSIGGVATAATVTGLTNGTAYQFRVAAINSYGVGAYSTASSPATPNTTTTTTVADSTTTTVADSTTTTVATLPVTGSSNGSIKPVLLALGFGGLLALFARRRVTER